MTRLYPRAAAAGIVLVLAALPTAGQPPAVPAPVIDVDRLGPKVGEAVPAFTLTDQYGTPRTLASVLGPKGAVLVFFRSADW